MFSYRNAVRHRVTFLGETADIGTIDELIAALDVLNRRYDTEILQQIAPALADLIVAGDRPPPVNLKALLKPLSLSNRLLVVDRLGDRLFDLIGNGVELRNLLVSLSDLEVEERVLRLLGAEGLRKLILTCKQLSDVVEWLYGDCELLFLDLLGADYLRRMIVRCRDFAFLMRCLGPERQLHLIEMLEWRFVIGLIRDGEDLVQTLGALGSAGCEALLGQLDRRRLIELIANEATWRELGRRLPLSNEGILLKKLEVTTSAAS